ncbi:CvpA family protein [Aquabacterium sp.]|uniref:CvpA family protein n=1 Tax=Aquabacterium sp. TaxID=1872578 RepID=UPI0025BEE8D6|nr:CvpA family protein [Aquabacterium sp.]
MSELVGGSAWTLVDVALALGLFLSIIVGAWRGLVTEVLALLGWAVAYFAAQWYGPEGAKLIPVGEPGSRLNLISGMLVVFVLAWLVWALISWAVAQMIKASVLSGPDRLLGAGFGLVRGVVVALVVCTVVSMTPVARWEPWQASRGVAGLQILLTGLRPVLPEQVVKFLPEQP